MIYSCADCFCSSMRTAMLLRILKSRDEACAGILCQTVAPVVLSRHTIDATTSGSPDLNMSARTKNKCFPSVVNVVYGGMDTDAFVATDQSFFPVAWSHAVVHCLKSLWYGKVY